MDRAILFHHPVNILAPSAEVENNIVRSAIGMPFAYRRDHAFPRGILGEDARVGDMDRYVIRTGLKSKPISLRQYFQTNPAGRKALRCM